MAGVKSLIFLALTGSAGMTLLILACTLGREPNWWPAIMLVFYVLAPIPIPIASRMSNDIIGYGPANNAPKEWAYFLTTGIIVSALALPIVMARAAAIATGAAVLSIASSIFFFGTIMAFFVVFRSEDSYSGPY